MRERLSLRTMLLYSVANAGTSLVAAFTNAALPLYLIQYGLPGWAIGLLAQERAGVGGLVQPIIGRISDRTRSPLGRRRPFFLIGAPITALAVALLAMNPPLAVMLVLLSILALLLAVANDPYVALMADIAPEEQRGRLGSFMGIFGGVGQVAMLFIASLFWDTNQSLVILTVAVGLLVCFGVTFFGVREPAAVHTLPPPIEPSREPLLGRFRCLGGTIFESPVRYFREVFGHREVAKYSLAMMFFWLGAGAAAPFLTRFGVFELGMPEERTFFLVMLLVAGTGLFAFPAGLLGDRMGKKLVLSVGLAFFAVAILVGSQARTETELLVAIFFVSVGNTIPYVLNYPLLADLIPRARAGEFVGLGSMLWSIGQPIGAAIGGLFVDLTNGYRAGFVFCGLMMIAAFAALQFVHPPTRSRIEV